MYFGYAQTDTNEHQNFRQIDQQRAALAAATATHQNKQLDFNRKATLTASGAISQSELDNAKTLLDVMIYIELPQLDTKLIYIKIAYFYLNYQFYNLLLYI